MLSCNRGKRGVMTSLTDRLNLVVNFLNLNLDSPYQKVRTQDAALKTFLTNHGLNNSKGKIKAKQLQKEIRQKLEPLITIPDPLVVKGRNRVYYQHANDPNLIIKMPKGKNPGKGWETMPPKIAIPEGAKIVGGVFDSPVKIQGIVIPPEAEVVGAKESDFSFADLIPKTPNAGESALFSSYIGYLQELTERINSILKIQLSVWQTEKDRKVIRTWWGGKLIVQGQLPDLNESSPEKDLYLIIAESLINGKAFSRLRMCRYSRPESRPEKSSRPQPEGCKKLFLTTNLHKAFCTEKCRKLSENLYYPSKRRVKKIRKKQDREKRQDRKRKILSLLPRLEEMAKKPEARYSVEEIRYIEKIVGTERFDAARTYLQNGNRGKALSILSRQGKSREL